MFPNLNAEQARIGDSNQSVAEFLGISRVSYENKKKTGKFTAPQISRLCRRYNATFEYLFAEAADHNTAQQTNTTDTA